MFVVPFRWIKTYALVILITLVCNITVFFRDALITARFGATLVTDAYTIALLIPEVLFNIFGNSLTANFVPIYYEAERAQRHRRFVATLFSLYLLLAGLIFLFGFKHTTFLITIFSSGFSGPAVGTASFLLRIFLVNIFLITVTNFSLVFLQAHKQFIIPSAIGIFYNFAVIAGVYYNGTGPALDALIIGTIVGFIIQFMVLMPQAVYWGLPLPAWRITFSPEIRKYVVLTLPVAFLAILGQLTIVMENYFASRLGEGSITTLNLGNRVLMGVYSTLITTTMLIVYPVLSKSIVQKEFKLTAAIMQKIINLLIILLLPLAVYFFINAGSLIDMIFKRGAFNAKQSALTATVFQGYIVGLFFYALRDLLLRYFFAAYNIPVLILNGLANTTLNFLYLMVLVPLTGLPGISLAAAFSVGSSCLILFLLARKQAPLFRQLKFFRLISKALLAAGLSMLIAGLSKPSINLYLAGENIFHELLRQGTEFILFGCFYCLFCLIMFKKRYLFA